MAEVTGSMQLNEHSSQEEGDTVTPLQKQMENEMIKSNEDQSTAEEIDTETMDSENHDDSASQAQSQSKSQNGLPLSEKVDNQNGTDVNMEEDADVGQSEKRSEKTTENSQAAGSERLLRLPLTRIKTIMKMDPEVNLASQEAVATIAKATVRRC